MNIVNKLHADEVDIDISLVSRLLKAQFPQWAGLTIELFLSSGTDNVIFRLGDDKIIRLPRMRAAASSLDKEHHWLPKLAPHLPLTIPLPLAKAKPDEGYPFHWSVYPWIEGENATLEHLADPSLAAMELAQFINALQQIDPAGGPSPQNRFSRGVPLALRDLQTRAAIISLQASIDSKTATAAWEAALHLPIWNKPPVWIHGDLQSGNLLALQGRLTAVIDFGALGVGDPACDLMPAWNLFSTETREIFRAELQVDDDTWARARGWALSVALIALPYYKTSNPILAKISQYTIDEVLADYKCS